MFNRNAKNSAASNEWTWKSLILCKSHEKSFVLSAGVKMKSLRMFYFRKARRSLAWNNSVLNFLRLCLFVAYEAIALTYLVQSPMSLALKTKKIRTLIVPTLLMIPPDLSNLAVLINWSITAKTTSKKKFCDRLVLGGTKSKIESETNVETRSKRGFKSSKCQSLTEEKTEERKVRLSLVSCQQSKDKSSLVLS